jgi:hypothetical protein
MRVVFVHECFQALTAVGIPDTDESIQSTRDNKGAVVYDIDASNRIGVGGKGAYHTRSSYIPNENGLIIGAADEDITLGCERYLVDVVVVAFEDFCVRSTLQKYC